MKDTEIIDINFMFATAPGTGRTLQPALTRDTSPDTLAELPGPQWKKSAPAGPANACRNRCTRCSL
jgi:hypothetical protein